MQEAAGSSPAATTTRPSVFLPRSSFPTERRNVASSPSPPPEDQRRRGPVNDSVEDCDAPHRPHRTRDQVDDREREHYSGSRKDLERRVYLRDRCGKGGCARQDHDEPDREPLRENPRPGHSRTLSDSAAAYAGVSRTLVTSSPNTAKASADPSSMASVMLSSQVMSCPMATGVVRAAT